MNGKDLLTVVSTGDELAILDSSENVIERMPIPEDLEESFHLIPKKLGYYVTTKNDEGEVQKSFHIVRAPLLHNHTDGSNLDGAIKADVLAELGGDVIAITDHGSMTETFHFYKAMCEKGKLPIIGYEAYAENLLGGEKEANHLILLVKNDQGYRNLCQIISEAEINMYRKPQVSLEMLEKYHEGLICTSACLGGEIPKCIADGRLEDAEEVIDTLADIFGDDFYLEIQRHNLNYLDDKTGKWVNEAEINSQLVEFARQKNLHVIATADSHYPREEDKEAHEILLCIGTHKTMADADHFRFRGDNYHIPEQGEFERLWADEPRVWEGLFGLAKKIEFEFTTGHIFMPKFDCPDGISQDEHFVNLVHKGYEEKFPKFDTPQDEAEHKERIEYEIKTILEMGFSGYFLIVQDFIAYARSIGGFVGPGRGSAVGSLAAYCLGITSLDPIPYGLLFERFLNPERVTMPDIDIDFDVNVRDKVINYCRGKYGDDCVSKIITFGTLSARAVIRDVGRVLGADLVKCDRFSKAVPEAPKITLAMAMKNSGEFKKLYEEDPELQRIYKIAEKLEGLNRHRSQHACGIIISNDAIKKFVPEILLKDKNSKERLRTASFTGPELEDLGLLKMDFLGLRNMSVIRDVVQMVPELSRNGHVSMTDPYVYKMIGTGSTIGIFQVESGGMQNLMRQMFYDVASRILDIEKKYNITGYETRMKGNRNEEDRKNYHNEMTILGAEMFERLIAAISLFRPGPMDNIPQYVAGMRDPETIHYDCPQLKPILSKTYGVIVYQEQVQQICRELAGYSLGRADVIRRAMGKKKQKVMDKEKDIFLYGNSPDESKRKKDEAYVPGCLANGVDEAAALIIWEKMSEFAKYAFNKSHSAGYANIAVTTGYLKLYYGAEFEVANINSLLGKAEDIQLHLNESRKMGIKVLSPSINDSEPEFTLENGGIRVGLKGLKNLGKIGDRIIDTRNHAWTSIEEFMLALIDVVDKRAFESLAYSGALDCFGIKRKVLVEKAEEVSTFLQKLRKFKSYENLPVLPEIEDLYLKINKVDFNSAGEEFERSDFFSKELEYCGIYVSGHPLDGLKDFYVNKEIVPVREILPTEEGDMEDDASAIEGIGVTAESAYNGKVVNVLGIAKSIKPKMTKKGTMMYFLKVEDESNSLEVAIWPNTVEKLMDADPMFFNKISNNPVIVNGRISTDSWGTKMSANSITLVDEDKDVSDCAEVWIEVPDKEKLTLANQFCSTLEPTDGNGTRIVYWYNIQDKGRSKAKVVGSYVMKFADFLRLKDSFRVISHKKPSKLNELGEVIDDWATIVA